MTGIERGVRFWIERNVFDSGVLAPNVGMLRHEDATTLLPHDGREIADAGRRAGYDLIMLASSRPVSLDGFVHLGTTEEYATTVADMERRLPRSDHFLLEQVDAGGWAAVETLLDYGAPTRFRRDTKLTRETAARHKMINIKARAAPSPEFTVLARSRSGEPLGFLCAFVRDRTFVLYELMIGPHAARGVIAGELLRENVNALRRRQPGIEKVIALVYTDNTESIAFFTRLGLRSTGRLTSHYHLWP